MVFRLLRVFIGISQFNYVGSAYHRKAKKLVEEITSSFDLDAIPQIPSNAKLKMQWYMAEFIYTCENFNRLSGLKSTPPQKKSYLLSGALVAMCDMVIDDIVIDVDRVKLLKRPTADFVCRDQVEELYLACYHTFIDSLHEDVKERTIEYYELLFDAQVRSKRQFDSNLTLEEVDQICKDKCGYSMLFLRAMVDGHISELEVETWFELGAFIQYCNDAQDLHKDLINKMRTFASIRSDLQTVTHDLDVQKSIAFSLIKKTPFSKKKKDDFLLALHVMHLGILAKLNTFSRVCGDEFSFKRFMSVDKQELRSKTNTFNLVKYVFPRALSYKYSHVEDRQS